METERIEEPTSSHYKIMDEGLEYIFSSMIRQGDTLDAIDFIKSLDVNVLPSKTVLRTVIFEILMKNDDGECLASSYDYLMTVLNEFPPSNEEIRGHYYHSIRDSQGYLEDLWTVVSHIVNSYFYHLQIYDIEKGESTSKYEPVKYPNCKFLLLFYVKLFSSDFEYLWVHSFQPCLIMMLLWRSNKIFLSNRTEALLKWINDIYSSPAVNTMGHLLGCLHDMVTLMIKCFLQAKFNLSEQAAFRHPCLSEVFEATVNFCKNAFANQENLKIFLSSLSLKCCQAKVSERIIKQITRQVSKRTYVSTLNDIVNQCMFPHKSDKWKNSKPNVNKEKNLRKRVLSKEKKSDTATSDGKLETTLIHELVKKNKFGDLYQAIHDSPEDINARDGTGCTPLHEACKAGSYWTVNVLISESKKEDIPNLDLTATNDDGFTPLHLAVKANSTEVVKALLNLGGSDLLKITDNKGFKPNDWSTDKEMNKLLQDYRVETSYESDSATESNLVKVAPKLKSFKEYSIYLQALVCLLGTYCELFNIYDFIWKKNDLVKSHAEKQCCHYLDEGVCSEDAAIASQMPDLVATFIESVKENVKKLELNVDIELIPLKAFAASMKGS